MLLAIAALTSAIPEMSDRGAYMGINSSLQQIAGGVAAAVAGMIVTQKGKGAPLEHYNIVGYTIVGISIISILLMMRVDKLVKRKTADQNAVIPEGDVVLSEGF